VSLAFLTADATPTHELHARSPMERLALQAGASLSRVAGWNVANAYDEPTTERRRLTQTVGFVDRSSLTKLELHAEPASLARIVAHASGGLTLAPGLAGRSDGADAIAAWWCPVTPGRVIVLGEPADAAALRAAVWLAADEEQGTVSVIDVTCGLAALSLVGPQARELLARFCAIDARPAVTPRAGFRPGSVARTPGYVLVEDHDRLLALVGWALGEYLWLVVADAAAALGGGPVGAEALAHHLQSGDAADTAVERTDA
jgi:heterotetrameric sarcosine oxidase gamma subunit